MTNVNITPILEGVISLVVAILSIVVIPKIKIWLNNKLTSSQIETIKIIVKAAVEAAEQIYANSSKSGASKKQFVLEYVQKKLGELGLSVDIKEIEIYLEQAVLELKKNQFEYTDYKAEVSE